MPQTVHLVSLNMEGHQNLAIPTLQAYLHNDNDLKRMVEIDHQSFTLPISPFSLFTSLLKLNPEIIGFSCYMWNIEKLLQVCAMVKTVRPECTVILGGPEVVGPRTEELLTTDRGIDFIIPGEGEFALLTLVKHLVLGTVSRQDVPGICYLQNKKICSKPANSLDLDQIPSPYVTGLISFEQDIIYHYIEGSRGCPYRCGYCLSGQQKLKGYSSERVIADLLEIFRRQLPCIQFVDPCFNYDIQRAKEILRAILNYNTTTDVHIALKGELIDEETIDLLRTLQDKQFSMVLDIGIQAVEDRTLLCISRTWEKEKLTATLHALCAIDNCEVSLSLVVGLPGDNYISYASSLGYVFQFDFTYLRSIICRLIPGCTLRREKEEYGIKFNPNPSYQMIENNTFSYADIQRANSLTQIINEWEELRQLYTFFLRLSFSKVSQFFEELQAWQKSKHTAVSSRSEARYRILVIYGRQFFRGKEQAYCHRLFTAFAGYFYFNNIHTYSVSSRPENQKNTFDLDSSYSLSKSIVIIFLNYELSDLQAITSGSCQAKEVLKKPNFRLFFAGGHKNIRLSKEQYMLLQDFKQPMTLVKMLHNHKEIQKKELAFVKFCVEQEILIGTKG